MENLTFKHSFYVGLWFVGTLAASFMNVTLMQFILILSLLVHIWASLGIESWFIPKPVIVGFYLGILSILSFVALPVTQLILLVTLLVHIAANLDILFKRYRAKL